MLKKSDSMYSNELELKSAMLDTAEFWVLDFLSIGLNPDLTPSWLQTRPLTRPANWVPNEPQIAP